MEDYPSELIVPGDITVLKSGDRIPADSIILMSNNLFVNEATLTGESFPVRNQQKFFGKNPIKNDQIPFLWGPL